MKLTTSTGVRGWTGLAAGCVAVAVLSGAPAAAAPQAADAPARQLVGTWMVQVTLRDCSTNAAVAAPVNSLVTFHRGGTLSESAGSPAFAPNQRSSGHGTWARLPGRSYAQRMIALVLFDTPANLPGTRTFDPAKPITPGFFAGWQTVSHTLQMTDADTATSSGTTEFYKADGSLYRSGCSTAVARRFN
jgi:hypothetical protein